MLVRYALERLLFRLSTSAHADRFVLKGALLFTLWYDLPHRATRDADLLGFGPDDTDSMAEVFRDIASIAGDDGIAFDPASVRVVQIRKEAGYGGVRVTLNGQLAGARCVAQVDVGFGDAVTPGPTDSIYPVLLDDLPAPRLRTYPVYTVIAEIARRRRAGHGEQSPEGLSRSGGDSRTRDSRRLNAGPGHCRDLSASGHARPD